MALTIAKVTSPTGVSTDFKVANKRWLERTFTFDSSYPTAGEPLTPADLGCKVIVAFIPCGAFRNTDATLGIVVSYNHTTSKLVAYWGNAGSVSGMPEVADTTDLSTYSGRAIIVCY